MNKLVLIDGHSILNRAFYGVPDLTNSKGMHTNAVYGFLNIMFRILDEEKPDYLAVAFDLKIPTFRHKMFEEYKGTRKPMPQELHEQVPVIKDVLQKMNIRILELPGYEADDILGTMAFRGEKDGFDVRIVSGDRDLLQLATQKIMIRIPKTKKGITEIENYYDNDVKELYGVTPVEFIDMKALMGDTSDNIPGVKSIGEKTAGAIISTFGSIENAYEHYEEIKPKRAGELLFADYENAKLSKKLATIDTNAPLECSLDECIINDMFNEEAFKIMQQLEFKSILKKFSQTTTDKAATVDVQGITKHINTKKALNDAIRNLKDNDVCFIDAYVIKSKKENTQLTFDFLMNEQPDTSSSDKLIVIVSSKDVVYVFESNDDADYESVYSGISETIRSLNTIITVDAKRLLKIFDFSKEFYDKKLFVHDLSVGAYLINPLNSSYTIDDIARIFLDESTSVQDIINSIPFSDDSKNDFSVSDDNTLKAFATMGYVGYNSFEVIEEALLQNKMSELYSDIEIPLVFVLNEMENEGIRIDRSALKDYSNKLKVLIDESESKIYKEIGVEFNINSPKQLGEILFDRMGLPGGKKTKTGYSTSADVLNKLADEYPIVNEILNYRQLTKLKSTYADGLDAYISDDGRIHGTFNQTITATGRISSTEPNLQNIPIRMDIGKRMRQVFVPKEGCKFIDADYSQIELRILAHMSGDEELIKAYNSHQDIHKATAAKVFKTPFEEVTDTQRSNAKAVNFGIVYGISSFGLSKDLSISKKEAEMYIKQYFETYKGIKTFLDSLIDNAKKDGYVTTLYGRKRPIPELSSSNFMQRSFGERIAMNSPIQGTAADIMKIAMLEVAKALREGNYKSRIVLQVHDELLIEAPDNEVDEIMNLVKETMQNAADLKVKLEVGIASGSDWLEAH